MLRHFVCDLYDQWYLCVDSASNKHQHKVSQWRSCVSETKTWRTGPEQTQVLMILLFPSSTYQQSNWYYHTKLNKNYDDLRLSITNGQ